MTNTNEAQKELKFYEYRIKATPEFVSPIEEGWEVIDVFMKLSNGQVEYLLVFRKQISADSVLSYSE